MFLFICLLDTQVSSRINSTQKILTESKDFINSSINIAVELEDKNLVVTTSIRNANTNINLTVNNAEEIDRIGWYVHWLCFLFIVL